MWSVLSIRKKTGSGSIQFKLCSRPISIRVGDHEHFSGKRTSGNLNAEPALLSHRVEGAIVAQRPSPACTGD